MTGTCRTCKTENVELTSVSDEEHGTFYSQRCLRCAEVIEALVEDPDWDGEVPFQPKRASGEE